MDDVIENKIGTRILKLMSNKNSIQTINWPEIDVSSSPKCLYFISLNITIIIIIIIVMIQYFQV